MDLVKIGFLIKADGLVKANKEIDALLAKADKLNNSGRGAGGGIGSGSGGKQRNQSNPAKEIDKTTKALEKQKIIGDYVSQGLDKSTATTLANFKQLGASTKDLNKMFAQLGNIKSLEQANKAVKDLAKAQKQAQKDIEKQEKALESTRQKRLSAEQKEYQKTQEQAKKSIKQQEQQLEASRQKKLSAEQKAYQKTQEDAKKLQQKQQDLANKAQQNADSLRQKTLAAEQKYYQKVQEEARKAAAKQQELSDKNVAKAEAARQKSLSSAQKEYQKSMELIQKQQQAQRAAQQKADEAQEKARQKKFSAEQKYYQQQQELAAKAARAQQDSINRQNQQRQNAVKQEETKAKYLGQGFSQTASTRLARMELSGADVATMERYKQALRDTAKAMNDMRPPAAAATEGNNRLLASIRGIAAYALLSTAIYGVITGVAALAKAMVTMSDEYTSIQNRMKLYVTDAQELTKVNAQLAQFSVANNVGLRETATLFTRLAPAMQKIGANTAAVTSVVDAFGKSLRIGGATAQEAASATIQFSQAMASGKLAGDEFRSISEASPRFLQAIAEGSGIAADQLKKMSAAGMLTTEVISKALLNEYPKLIEENKKLGVTLEQGANALKTGFLVAFGEFNEGAGITKALGESMANLAQDMFKAAQTARETGADVKKWFEENANTIQTVVEVIKLLAVTIVSKYVASMVVAGAISLKTAYSLNVASLGATAVQRAFGLAAIAAIRLGGALSALATPKNLFTLGLTVAAVAASYLLMRGNAAEATQKLVEQSKYVDITTEAYQELNKEQQLNARSSIVNDLNDTNKKLDEQAAAVENVLKSYATSRQFSGLGLDKGTKEIINGVTKGVLSYDTALRLLSENSNVPKRIVEGFKKENDIYNETYNSAIKFADAAKIVGVDSEISGNKMQNAAIQAQSLGNKYSDVGDEAEIAGGKVRKFYQDLQADTKKNILAFDLSNKLNISPSTANKVADELSGRAAQEEGLKNKELINQRQKLVKLQTDLSAAQVAFSSKKNRTQDDTKLLREQQLEVEKQHRIYDNMRKSKPYVKVNPNSLLTEEDKKTIKAYDASTSLSSNQTKADKKTDKEREKDLKHLESIREGYDDQIAAVVRLNNFKAEGMPYDVAKIAAEKDYYEAYTNVEKAFELAEARKTLARIDAKGALENETLLLTKLLLLQEKGVGYELARTLAQAAFSDDQEGMLAAAQSMHNELVAQQYSLADQVKQQTLLNHYLDKGLTLEEATVKASFKRLENIQKEAGMKGLSDQQKKLKEDTLENQKQLKIKQTEAQVSQSLTNAEKQRVAYVNAQAGGYANLIQNMAIANKIASDPTLSPDQAKKLVEAEELTNYEKELAELKRQTYITTLNESDAVKTLVGNYSTVDSVQIGVLAKQQQLLEIAKELAEEAEKQRNNPIGDFSNVDFSVFGDFGNPFQSALDGMNELIRTTMSGGEQIKKLNEEIDAAKLKGLDTTQQEFDLNLEMQKQTKDKKQATDKAITSALSLTKSLFKEESKGYKFVSGLEKAYQASKIAFALWEKKDTIKTMAIKLAGYAKDMAMFIGGIATKITAQMGLNVVQAQGAVAAAAQAPPPVGFASAAAMIALLAGVGIAISGGGGEYVDTSNQGTGTLFGDSEAQSASIANSIDLLSENSDLMLPLTSAMLASLRNIESSIGGVTNLVVRQATGQGFNVQEGFKQNGIGSAIGSVGQLAGGVGGAIGGGIAGAFGAGLLGAGMGSALGIGLGLATGGIGLLLGASLGKLLGGLFGSKTKITGQGLSGSNQELGGILSDGYSLQEYVDVQTKKKSFGITTSKKNSTQYSEASAELSNQFTLIFKGFNDAILAAAPSLGKSTSEVTQKLNNFVVSVGRIDLKDLNGEQIQEKLEAVFGAEADKMAQAAVGGLEDFQKVGEGYFETLVRVATGVETASYFTDRLNVTTIKYNDIINKQGDVAAEMVRQSVLLVEGNKNINGGFYDLVNTFDGTAEEITDFVFTLRDLQDQLFMTGKNADYLTSSMILGAGGLDSLASGLDAYFEMLSPAEQAAELTRRLTNEFAIFGKELPANVRAYRDLVNSITDTELATEAGQKLYGQIIALAPEFNDLQDALESANSEVNALVQSLRNLAEQARAARGETEQPRNLAYTRSQFEQASILAMQGDVASAEKLLTLGNDLMGLSKTYSVSGSEYARDLALIQRASTVSADIQEQGLGTSISTTLTPSSGTTTTPTVNTNTTSTDAKLDALSEKLEAGLFAIAKYTQDSASRLERWDDGGRMMVGIQPENGDTPVPVVVTP